MHFSESLLHTGLDYSIAGVGYTTCLNKWLNTPMNGKAVRLVFVWCAEIMCTSISALIRLSAAFEIHCTIGTVQMFPDLHIFTGSLYEMLKCSTLIIINWQILIWFCGYASSLLFMTLVKFGLESKKQILGLDVKKLDFSAARIVFLEDNISSCLRCPQQVLWVIFKLLNILFFCNSFASTEIVHWLAGSLKALID